MNFDFYIVLYCIIVIAFVIVMLALAFGHYNNNILKKSYVDTRIYIYVVMLSAIFFLATILVSANINYFDTILSYIIFSAIFVCYSISIMIMLLVTLRPLHLIDDRAKKLALGKKNLNVDFEGALEFESLAKSFNDVQKKYKENDRALNKKDFEYQKFIPKQYLSFFGTNKIENLEVGDAITKKLSVMFCDLRNSYFSSETLGLQENFSLISEFLKSVTSAVKKNGGFVDSFLGDGAVAIFINEDDALKCANEIAKQLDYKNLISIGKEPIKYGISLNSGMCVIGIVGDEKQKQFTVVADVVNLCSRIEGLNKIFGTRVLMTKQFMNNLKDVFSYRYIGTMNFDDLTSSIPLFESLDAYEDTKKVPLSKSLQEFESGVRFYEKGEYEKAKQFFAICVKNDNEDKLSKFYISKVVDEMATKLIAPK